MPQKSFKKKEILNSIYQLMGKYKVFTITKGEKVIALKVENEDGSIIIVLRWCKKCNKAFLASTKHKKFCRKACKQAFHRKKKKQ